MNLAFYELEPWEQEHVRKALPGHRLSFFDGPLGAKNVDKKAEAIGIFIYSEATRKLINLMPRLKLIATLSTGFDHIDIAYAASKGIQVCNVPTYGENTVAAISGGMSRASRRASRWTCWFSILIRKESWQKSLASPTLPCRNC